MDPRIRDILQGAGPQRYLGWVSRKGQLMKEFYVTYLATMADKIEAPDLTKGRSWNNSQRRHITQVLKGEGAGNKS